MKKGSVGKSLTSREAARVLGVSEASVKRWADSGLLRTFRTAGGHRRFAPEDIVSFRLSAFRDDSPPESTRIHHTKDYASTSPPANTTGLADEMFERLTGGSAEAVASFLFDLCLGGRSIAWIADNVLCPALRRIGDCWQRGTISVAGEHIATRAALAALRKLQTVINQAPARNQIVICCSTENDFHDLPALLAGLTLEVRGWDVISLGASTPFFALNEAAERFRPRLVCVASTQLFQPERAAREFDRFRRTARELRFSVVLGGAGFAGPARARFDADLHAESFTDLDSFAAAIGG